MIKRDATQRRWAQELNAASVAIPAEWIYTDPDDGWQGIYPEHSGHPLVRHYAKLCQLGYFRGWVA
jgi:hypothetical protein